MAPEAGRQTAFHTITSKTAAGFSEEAGWLWVTNFGDVDAEYRAIREGVGMWDLSPLNKWEVIGPDAVEAVQRVHTANITAMDRGQVRYGAFVDEDGMVVDDGTVFRFDEEHLWVCTNSNEREEYFASATKGLDVQIRYIAPELPSMQIQGPKSRDLMHTITDADLDGLRYFRFFPDQVQVGGVPVWLSRTGFSGELGYEVFLRAEHAGALWAAVSEAGAVPYGADVIEPIRVEAGMIVTDYDYEPGARTPFDLGLDRFVALHELNMGTEKLRAVAADPPNRFVSVRLQGDELPEYGAPVTRDGEEIGVLTSPAESPRHGPIGLAILRTETAVPGTEVLVAGPSGAIAGTVDVLSIDDPAKERPRS